MINKRTCNHCGQPVSRQTHGGAKALGPGQIAAIVCELIGALAFLALAITAPFWLKPEHYLWTALILFLMLANAGMFSWRFNNWRDIGRSYR